jgi:hypothetical protein
LRSLEEDFATVEFVVQVKDRRHIALGRVIGDPIALFVLPTIIRMSTMVTSRTDRGQNHRLGIERLAESPLIAYIAQTFFEETRYNLGIGRITKLRPIDDRKSCIIPNLRQMDMSIVHRHQPTTILGADRI